MFRLYAPVVLLVTLAACGGVTDPSQNKTETFTDTIMVGKSSVKTFNVPKTGEYLVKVVSMTPTISSNTYFYAAFGQSASGGCAAIQANTFAVVGSTVLSGAIISSGSYCVILGDEGFFTVDETYTITVSHP